MSSVRRGFLNNRLFQLACLFHSLPSSESRRLKSIKLCCIVILFPLSWFLSPAYIAKLPIYIDTNQTNKAFK